MDADMQEVDNLKERFNKIDKELHTKFTEQGIYENTYQHSYFHQRIREIGREVEDMIAEARRLKLNCVGEKDGELFWVKDKQIWYEADKLMGHIVCASFNVFNISKCIDRVIRLRTIDSLKKLQW